MFSESISKKKLWQYVNIKINRTIHHYHVFSVISLLFEEILSELKDKGEIKIHNFGVLSLKHLKPRHYFDITRQQVMRSNGYRILRFTLAPRLKKKIISYLDTSTKEIT
jgi:nucleoid DNA-binding protein